MKREDGGRKKGETGTTTTTTDLTKTGVRWIKRRREEEGERKPRLARFGRRVLNYR